MTALQPVMGTDQHGLPTVNTEAARAEFERAGDTMADQWVVGCGGNEQPSLTSSRRWVLYVWNFATLQHGWLDLSTDVVDLDWDRWD